MAQCASAHAALVGREGSGPAMRGLLLGTRVLALRRRAYAPGEELRVEALHLKGETGLVIFACALRASSGAELASARLNLYAEPVERSQA